MLGWPVPPLRGRDRYDFPKRGRERWHETRECGDCRGGRRGRHVAKELAAGGLSVVLLERGKWYTAADCRKDDLRNQRTSVLGNAFGPDDERNPRVGVDLNGRGAVVLPSEGGYRTMRRAWAAARSVTGRRRGAIMKQDFRMRSTYGAPAGQHAGRLADLVRRPGAVLREGGIRNRRFGGCFGDPFHGPRRKPLPMPPLPPNREYGILEPAAKRLGLHPFRSADAAQYRAV